MMSVTEGKSIHLDKTTSKQHTEENHSEYESRMQKLRIESVASLAVHRIERCAEETFREADLTLECIWMYHHY